MKKKGLLVLMFCLCQVMGWAYDSFEVDGISYKIISQNEVGISSGDFTGDIFIPATVSYGGKTYSVTGTSGETFWGCSDLLSITVDEKNEFLFSSDGILYRRFEDKIILDKYPAGKTDTEFTVPDNVYYIGFSAFESCSRLKTIIFSEGLYGLSADVFLRSGITTVNLPESVEYLYTINIFKDCENVYISNPIPPRLEKDDFNEPLNCLLYVPLGSKSTYETAIGWKNFKNIIELDFTSIEISRKKDALFSIPSTITDGFTLEGISGNATITIYSLSGAQVMQVVAGEGEFISLASLPAGAYVMRMQMGRSVVDKKVIKRN